MKNAVCTISTKSHLFKAEALFSSLAGRGPFDLFCLLTDVSELDERSEGVKTHVLADLNSDLAMQVKRKYRGDRLRWALKPIYLQFLIDKGYLWVFYCDNDLFFYNSPEALMQRLEGARFLLTPHFYPANPRSGQNWLEANFRVGLYNAGFIGVSNDASEILTWWAQCCLYNMKKAFWRGLYDDQKYLDLLPVRFSGVAIVKDRGCNLAGWNDGDVLLSRSEGQMLVDGNPLTFIHFADLSMQRFSKADHPLYPEWEHYRKTLERYNPAFRLKKERLSRRALGAFLYFVSWSFRRFFEKLNQTA